MEIANSEFGVGLPVCGGELYAAAVQRLVIPVEPLAVMRECGLDIRHECGSAESFGDYSLRHISLTDPVAPLHRGYVAETRPGRTGKAVRLLSYGLPAKPVLDVQRQTTTLKTTEAVLVGVSRAQAYYAVSQKLIQL